MRAAGGPCCRFPGLSSFPVVTGRTAPGSLRAGGRETLVGGSPDGTDTVELLYTSSRGIDSSLRNATCAFLRPLRW